MNECDNATCVQNLRRVRHELLASSSSPYLIAKLSGQMSEPGVTHIDVSLCSKASSQLEGTAGSEAQRGGTNSKSVHLIHSAVRCSWQQLEKSNGLLLRCRGVSPDD